MISGPSKRSIFESGSELDILPPSSISKLVGLLGLRLELHTSETWNHGVHEMSTLTVANLWEYLLGKREDLALIHAAAGD